jgi:hypothetical protein
MRCLNGAMLWAGRSEIFQEEVSSPRTAARLDEALSLLRTVVDEAGSYGTLGLFLRMAEWVIV